MAERPESGVFMNSSLSLARTCAKVSVRTGDQKTAITAVLVHKSGAKVRDTLSFSGHSDDLALSADGSVSPTCLLSGLTQPGVRVVRDTTTITDADGTRHVTQTGRDVAEYIGKIGEARGKAKGRGVSPASASKARGKAKDRGVSPASASKVETTAVLSS